MSIPRCVIVVAALCAKTSELGATPRMAANAMLVVHLRFLIHFPRSSCWFPSLLGRRRRLFTRLPWMRRFCTVSFKVVRVCAPVCCPVLRCRMKGGRGIGGSTKKRENRIIGVRQRGSHTSGNPLRHSFFGAPGGTRTPARRGLGNHRSIHLSYGCMSCLVLPSYVYFVSTLRYP